jgi:hypothetical protein
MCPDRQILSLYSDKELPSPWKEKLESHLENCPDCQSTLAGYRQLGEMLREPDSQTVQAAQDRLWKKLGEAKTLNTSSVVLRRERMRIWSRSISLPLPLAAAAAVLIIVIFLALIGVIGPIQSPSQDRMAAINIELDDHEIVPIPVQDLSGVLQYLSSQDGGDFMVVRLPETRRFTRVGEPALINAADYSRRNTFR